MQNLSENYINGQWIASGSSEAIAVINPATEQSIGQLTFGTTEDVNRATKAARRAFSTWSLSNCEERLTLLERLLVEFDKRADELAKASAKRWAPHCDSQPPHNVVWRANISASVSKHYATMTSITRWAPPWYA